MARKKRTRRHEYPVARAAAPAARPVARAAAPATQTVVRAAPLSWSRALCSPALVAATVLLFYGVWLAYFVPRSNGGLRFPFMGRVFLQESRTSPVIKVNPSVLSSLDPYGYDGQFYYYIALDPLHARYYTDGASYRYTRIGYPIVARLLGLGRPALIPYALIAVNWLAIAGGTLAVAAWLRRRGYVPWIALIYALYPGLPVALSLDLTEALGYALVAVAVYLLYFGGRYRLVWAGLSFALALLTRETTALFAVLYGVALLLERGTAATWRGRLAANWPRAALLLGLAGLPMGQYKLFLRLWLGSVGLPLDAASLLIPFHGLFTHLSSWQDWHTQEVRSIVVPALLCAGLGLWALYKRIWAVEIWILLANVVVCVVQLVPASYDAFRAPARISTGVMLAALYCLPVFDRLTRRNRLWLAVCAALWLWLDVDWLQVLLRVYPA